MRSAIDKKQIIAETNKIKQELKYSKAQKVQQNFVKKFLKDNKKMVIFYCALVALETLVSLSLPIISRLYLKNSFDLIDYRTFYLTVAVLVGLTFVFLVNSYYSLLNGTRLIMALFNEIREAWFIQYFKMPSAFKASLDNKKLLTKFLYHAQLFKLGFTNVVSEGLHAFMLYAGILIYSFIFNDKLFIVLFLSAPLLILIFVISYFIGRFYVAREQTFNTKIVGQLADSILSYDLYKVQNRELEKIQEMENLIDLDTHFRIRRQVWIKYSNQILYGFILLFGIGLYVVQTFWPFFELDSAITIASDGIILGFFTRLLFLVSRAGIFFPAFSLGVKLAVPNFDYEKSEFKPQTKKWDDLTIKSKKTKLSYYGDYIKNISIPFEKGQNVLFFTPEPLGKTTLAKIITGQRCTDSVIFHVDKKRTSSTEWCDKIAGNYLISPEIKYDTTIGEVIFGKNNLLVDAKEIKNAHSTLKQHEIFNFIFDNTKTLGKPANTQNLSNTQKILIQIAHCLIYDKQIIAIDHFCLDSMNKLIKKGLELLIAKKPSAAIAFFSSQNNNLFEYAKTYEIKKQDIKEI